jgi:hypothetical protein
MIDTLRRALALCPLLATATLAMPMPAFSQGPTEAQRAAVKAQCRSDYIAHCSDVTPGGAAALQCLQKNMANLSASCQSAVRAVEASVEKAEPKAEAKPESKPESTPAETAAKPATEPAPTTAQPTEPAAAAARPASEPSAAPAASKATSAKAAGSAAPGKPSSAQIAAIRSACRSDYPKVCAGVQPGGAAALECLEKNKAKVSPACEKAVSAASGGGAATAAAPADTSPAAAPAAAPTVIMLRPLRPREELFIVRSACGGDVRTLCAGVAPGGDRIAQCLATNAASLSPACKDVLAPFAAR